METFTAEQLEARVFCRGDGNSKGGAAGAQKDYFTFFKQKGKLSFTNFMSVNFRS